MSHRTRSGLPGVKFCRGCILKPSLKGGYRYVNLGLDGQTSRKTRKVAVLVLEAFVGLKPFKSAQALHWDDNRVNDTLENLRWGSPSENAFDCIRNGNHRAGIRKPLPQTEAEWDNWVAMHSAANS